MKGFYTTLFALFLLVVCVSAAPTVSTTDVEKKETGTELMEDNMDGLDVSVRSGHGYYRKGKGPYYYRRRRRPYKYGRRPYRYGRRRYGYGYGHGKKYRYGKYGGYGSSSGSDYGYGSSSGYSS